jgi:transcriptional regulator with XRE-family HTH domain
MPAGDDRRDALTRSRHKQLGAFLRARRALIAPEDVGLPERKRRHVPGLRREEVAQLAQIGVSWYTLLEQGRIDQVSSKTLRRVIRTLRLSPVEAEHALALARETDARSAIPVRPSDELHAFVRGYSDGAAFLTDSRSHVMAWNAHADALFAFSRYAEDERNMLALMVRSERMRGVFGDWYDTLRRMIGVFRATNIPYGDDVDGLIAALRAENSDFDELWKNYDVRRLTGHLCLLRDERRGEVRMCFMALAPVDYPDHILVTLREPTSAL